MERGMGLKVIPLIQHATGPIQAVRVSCLTNCVTGSGGGVGRLRLVLSSQFRFFIMNRFRVSLAWSVMHRVKKLSLEDLSCCRRRW